MPQRRQTHLVGMRYVPPCTILSKLTEQEDISRLYALTISLSQARVKADRQALEGVAQEDRCTCPHSVVDGKPGVYEVKEGVTGAGAGAKTNIGYEA